MARRPLTDAQIAALPPEKRAETLKKRRQREAKRQAAAAVVKPMATVTAIRPSAPPATSPQHPADAPHGIEQNDERAMQMYQTLMLKMQRAGTWNDEACHGPLVLYCKSVVLIEREPIDGLPASVLTQVSKLHAQLGLANLPADRVAKSSKFAGGW